MPRETNKPVYGRDTAIDFTGPHFKARRRWTAEVETFKRDLSEMSQHYHVDDSGLCEGVVKVKVNELVDGTLKTSFKKAPVHLVINFEIPRDYPMTPPLVWIESPTLTPTLNGDLVFGIFSGVPCLKELKIGGWTPIFNLSSIFTFVLNAISEHTVVQDPKGSVTRAAALSGSEQVSRAHPDWNLKGDMLSP